MTSNLSTLSPFGLMTLLLLIISTSMVRSQIALPTNDIATPCTLDTDCTYEANYRCHKYEKICKCPIGFRKSLSGQCKKIACTTDESCNAGQDARYLQCNQTDKSCECITHMHMREDGFACVTEAWIIAVILSFLVASLIGCICCAFACYYGFCGCIGGPSQADIASASLQA